MKQLIPPKAPTYIVLLAALVFSISLLAAQGDDTASDFQTRYLASESQDDGPDRDETAPSPVIDSPPLSGVSDAPFVSHTIPKRESPLPSVGLVASSHLNKAPPI